MTIKCLEILRLYFSSKVKLNFTIDFQNFKTASFSIFILNTRKFEFKDIKAFCQHTFIMHTAE